MRRFSFGIDMKTGKPMTPEQTEAVRKRHEFINRRGYKRAIAHRGEAEAGHIFGGHWKKVDGRFTFIKLQERKQ